MCRGGQDSPALMARGVDVVERILTLAPGAVTAVLPVHRDEPFDMFMQVARPTPEAVAKALRIERHQDIA